MGKLESVGSHTEIPGQLSAILLLNPRVTDNKPWRRGIKPGVRSGGKNGTNFRSAVRQYLGLFTKGTQENPPIRLLSVLCPQFLSFELSFDHFQFIILYYISFRRENQLLQIYPTTHLFI